jgi:uncharacterized protein (TIGR03435 family)
MMAIAAISLALLARGLFAQAAFEVASVKLNSGGSPSGMGTFHASPTSLSMTDTSLSTYIEWAYNVQDYQLSIPASLDKDKFDIAAKSGGPGTEDQLRTMLQALLADRFKLALHRESKTMAVYALVVGANGPKLHPSEDEGETELRGRGTKIGVVARRCSIADLAGFLSHPMQLPVVDKTGLAGRYDFTLDISPYISAETPVQRGEIPGLFQSALLQQLGLKLEARKLPVEVLVIDHAERPSEN